MQEKTDKIIEQCLKEMFKRVGEKYPNKELTDKPQWYTTRTWSQEEEKDFKKWMKKKLKKAWPYMRAKRIDYEISMFLLMWGWKCDSGFESLEKAGEKKNALENSNKR